MACRSSGGRSPRCPDLVLSPVDIAMRTGTNTDRRDVGSIPLPLAPVRHLAGEWLSSVTTRARGGSIRPPRVVLVDDERLVRDLLRGRLEGDGFDVVDEAAIANAAITTASLDQPDLVILGVVLSAEVGTEIIAAVRETVPDADIIVDTAATSPILAAAARRAGATEVIGKAEGHVRVLHAVWRVSLRRYLSD